MRMCRFGKIQRQPERAHFPADFLLVNQCSPQQASALKAEFVKPRASAAALYPAEPSNNTAVKQATLLCLLGHSQKKNNFEDFKSPARNTMILSDRQSMLTYTLTYCYYEMEMIQQNKGVQTREYIVQTMSL